MDRNGCTKTSGIRNWRHFCFLTDLAGDAVDLDCFHRAHATVELAIRDLKEGAGLEHTPSGNFYANSAWLICAVLAHDLVRWTALLGDVIEPGQLAVAGTMRRTLVAIPGRLVSRSGIPTLRMPRDWPWQKAFERSLGLLRALPLHPI